MTPNQPTDQPLDIGLVIYGDLDATSGGFRYDRKLVRFLRNNGDTVSVISLPWRSYPRNVISNCSQSIRSRLNQPVDILLEDGLCHPSLWWHNRQLTEPGAVVGLCHHVQSDDPTERFGRLMRPFERRFFTSVDATLATSEFTRSRAQQVAPAVATRPSLVAPPAGRRPFTGTSRPSKSTLTQGAADGPLRILFVGNLLPRKDPKTLLSAIKLAEQRRLSDWELTVIGSHDANPNYARETRVYADELGLADRVEFAGNVPTAALESAFERSHVCCVPSRYEGFGMVYLEAMEYGTVPIASALGGPGEFIDHGHNGFIVEPGDTDAIATQLVALGSDRSRLASLSQHAVETAVSWPTWDETLCRVRSFLGTVAERHR